MVSNDKQTAFLNILLGGTGREAGRHLHELAVADQRPFPTTIVQIDTEPRTESFVDRPILIPLDGGKIQTMKASPATFGEICSTIVENYGQFLNPEDIGNGARTIRLLTQLAFAYHYESILRGLRNSILDLYHQGGIGGIIPVLISSSGGGTGSALQILLPQALNDPWFASRLTEGLPSGVLQTPILFLVEPFAYALRNQTMHADKILANSYGFRMESVLLEAMRAYKYCFHLGLANDDGAVLDSPEEIAKVLGTSVYQFERHWPQIKGRVVDTADTHALTARYTGYDIPEHVIHRANGVPIASYAHDSPNGDK